MIWRPKRRLGRVEMDMLRQLFNKSSVNKEDSNHIKDLSEKFGISWEAVKRILKSKWTPSSSILDKSKRDPSLFDDQLNKFNSGKR